MATLFGALSLMFVSCQSIGGWLEDPVETKLRVGTNPLDKAAGSQFLNVTASGDWIISVTYPEVENETGTVEEWLSVSPACGKGSKSSVILQWSANAGNESREATLTLYASGKSYGLTLTQKGAGSGSGSETSFVPKSGWMELPEVIDDDGHDFFCHTMTIGSVETRNYSFYYSYGDYLALWVAYPLCNWNIGGAVNRTNAWGVDPLLPRDKQAVLYYNSFRNTNYEWTAEEKQNKEYFARGHQIPSADRLTSYDSNSMTFYSTNMTPQRNNAFNSTIWANLEGKVRAWAKKCDTLYVVTGCVVDGSTDYCYDNDNKKVTVPTAYFKACLSYSKSGSAGTKGYRSIAVWMDHKEYSDSYVSKDYALSVSELEERLGYRLFVNLDDKVGSADAQAIKDSKSTSWWW